MSKTKTQRLPSFIEVTSYVDPEIAKRIDELAKGMNNSRSATAELLLKRALGMVSDVEIEDLFKVGRR